MTQLNTQTRLGGDHGGTEPHPKRHQLPRRLYLANLGRLSPRALAESLAPLGFEAAAPENRDAVALIVSDGCGKAALRATAQWGSLDTGAVTQRAAFHELMAINDHGFVVTDSLVLSRFGGRGGVAPTLPRDGVYFFRPDNDTDGRHLQIVSQQSELDRVWRDWVRYGPGKKALLSAQVPRPLLLANGHKFHVRLIVLAVSGTRGSRVALLKRGQLVSAMAPYTDSFAEQTNRKIHCSNMVDGVVTSFPDNFPADSADFFARAAYRLRRVFWLAPSVDRVGKLNAVAGSKLVMEFPWSVSTAEGGLAILAVDMLVDTIGRLFVLKISDSPRFLPSGCSMASVEALSSDIFRALAEFGVDDPGYGASLAHVEELWRTPTVIPRGLAAPPTNTRTYLPAVEWLDIAAFHQAMSHMGGWRPVTLAEAQHLTVDLVVVDGRWNTDRRLYSLRARIKARLDAKCIENKVVLQELVAPHYPDVMPEAIVVGESCTKVAFPGHGIWIWRPHGEFSGKGVVVVPDQATLDAVVAHRRPGKRAVLSRYILDPLLLDGVKFHVRLNLLVVVSPRGKRAALYRHGYINRATLPFVAGDFGNTLIHDSHTQKNLPLPFPEAFPGGCEPASVFFDKACHALRRVCQLAFTSIQSYGDCESAFEIFGTDLMIDTAGRVFLLEINSKPGYPHNTAAWARSMTANIVGGIAEFVIEQDGIDVGGVCAEELSTPTNGKAHVHFARRRHYDYVYELLPE